MDFASFILVNAALFIRPAEIVPALATVPIYQILILLCLILSLPKLLIQWTSRPLSDRPITACMLGVWASVFLSHLAHLDVGLARWWGTDFARVVLYYLLFVGVIDTPSRLRAILAWLVVFIAAMTLLSLSQYHGLIYIESLEVLQRPEIDPETGEVIIVLQLVGTGIFNDPNDYAIILAMGIIIGLYFMGDRRFSVLRFLWLLPTGIFLYALLLTQSRGGLLALGGGLVTLLGSRLRMRTLVILLMLGGPVCLVVLGGRFAKMSAGEDTAQQRIGLWRESMALFRGSPIFGIGANTLADYIGLVAHNSYVQSYAETGFVGGTFFVGMFTYAISILRRAGRPGHEPADPESRRTRPYLMAILVSCMVGLYSITRGYVASTYIPSGLAEAFAATAFTADADASVGSRFTFASLRRLSLISVGVVVWIMVFIRVFAQ